jgi:uncharacterized OB-fold protein
LCPFCWSADVRRETVAPRGTVNTYTVVHRNDTAQFRDRTPYAVVAVDLDDDWRVIARVEGDPSHVAVGVAVEVAVESGSDPNHPGYIASLLGT